MSPKVRGGLFAGPRTVPGPPVPIISLLEDALLKCALLAPWLHGLETVILSGLLESARASQE